MAKKLLFLLAMGLLCLSVTSVTLAQNRQLIIGINYAPIQPGSDPTGVLTEEQIGQDLDMIAQKFTTIRIYQSQGVGEQIVNLARDKQIQVVIEAWLTSDSAHNEAEIASAITLANRYSNVVGVIVGSEVLSRGDMTPEQLIDAITRVRQGVPSTIPVGYSEVFMKWVQNPEVAQVVDWVGLDSFGFLDCQAEQAAIRYSINQWALLISNPAFSNEKVVLTETGWPSDGLVNDCLNQEAATPASQAQFVDDLINNVTAAQLDTFVLEFADSTWRCSDGSDSYACAWGLVEANRNPKAAWDTLPQAIRPPEPLPVIAVVSSDDRDAVNCRAQPGTEQPVLVGVSDGESVEIVDRTSSEDWVLVRYQGTDCWIHYSLLTVDGRPMPPGSQPFDMTILDVNRFVQSTDTSLCQGQSPSEFAGQTWRAVDTVTIASCVHNMNTWMHDAKAQQEALVADGTCSTEPSTLDADVQNRFQTYWALDNIAIAYYNLGRSLRSIWQFQLAQQAFETVTNDLSCAWAYDSSSGDTPYFWSVAQEARNQLNTLPLTEGTGAATATEEATP